MKIIELNKIRVDIRAFARKLFKTSRIKEKTFSTYNEIKNYKLNISGIIFLWVCLISLRFLIDYLQLKFPVNFFDGSLRLASALYASNGLVPYKDFSFLYPPGLVILSQIFHLNFVSYYHLISLLLLTVSISLAFFFLRKTNSLLYPIFIILLLLLNFDINNVPLIDILWFSFLSLSYFFIIEGKKTYILPLILLGVSVFFLKWERFVILALLFIPLVSISFFLKKNLKNITRLSIIIFSTLFLSLSFFLIYCFVQKIDVLNALYFIVEAPLKIMPFRKLPLPPPALSLNISSLTIIFYSSFLFFFLMVFLILKNFKKIRPSDVYLLIIPVPVLFYALGRFDSFHALPLYFTVALSVCLYAIIHRNGRWLFYLVLIYTLLAFRIYNYKTEIFLSDSPYPPNIAKMDLDLSDCKKTVGENFYKSIFVGRDEYVKYIGNYSILYLLNPFVKPASQYVSDEPGLQNTCYDGKRISKDLSLAPKPMLVFIDKEHLVETKAIQTMRSCGFIEKWLKSKSYKKIGTCNIYGKNLEVRIYK